MALDDFDSAVQVLDNLINRRSACQRTQPWENAAAESKQISGWFDPAGLLLAPGGSSGRMRLSLSAESYVYFSLPTHPTP
jgi:hypothetical protein